MIRIVALYGSSKRKRNSDLLMDKFLEGFGKTDTEVHKVFSSSAAVHHCAACDGCYKEGKCVVKDEMQDIYAAFEAADVVVTASPVYFHTVPSHLKAIIYRCQAVWAGKYVAGSCIMTKKKRYGYIICTAGSTEVKNCFDCTVKVLDLFHKCINAGIKGMLLAAGLDDMPAADNEELLQKAYNEGAKLRKEFEADK